MKPHRRTSQLVSILLAAIFGLWAAAACDDDHHGNPAPPDQAAEEQWYALHGNKPRTDSVDATGVTSDPEILFDLRDPEPSPYNGVVIGPVDEAEYGVPYLLYRELGPGPFGGFNPPPEIDYVFGTRAAIQAIHPFTGEVLAEFKLNFGAFQNFPAVDPQGDVWVGDTARITHFAPGLKRVIRTINLAWYVGPFFPTAAVAGTPMFLSDGNLVVPFLGGQILLIERDTGEVLDMISLGKLDPPVAEDPQYGMLGVYLRNAVTGDGDEQFYLVNGEMIRVDYDPVGRKLLLTERTDVGGFSSSTPTLDPARKRMWIITLDPTDPESTPMLKCYDYGSNPMELLWEIPASVASAEALDQLTVTYIASLDLIINNSLYGPVEAYRETEAGDSAERVWTVYDTVSPDFMAYIASATERDGMLYVHDLRSRGLYGLDAATGTVRWRIDVPFQSLKTPIPYNGIVYFDHLQGLLAIKGGS